MKEPDFQAILKGKRDYYGHTEAAIEFAASEYSRQMLIIRTGNENGMERLSALEDERLRWSLHTFPEATAHSSLFKLFEEMVEIEADIIAGKRRPEEYADAMMCVFDSAGRQGIFLPELIGAFNDKLQKNKSRRWVKNPDNTYSHTKT